MIALLCSVPFEAEALLVSLKKDDPLDVGSKTVHRGTLGNQAIALCAGGMGKANAAHAAALLITRYDPEALIIFGIGGAYPSAGANIGDIALASEEIYGDEGVLTVEGFRDTTYIGIPLAQTARGTHYNRVAPPIHLFDKASRALSTAHTAANVHAGKFVTLSTCTGTGSRARELESLYGALCENMEGAAAAQVAELHGIPWIEVRGISNIVEERDLNKWNIPKAAHAVQAAVQLILTTWKQ